MTSNVSTPSSNHLIPSLNNSTSNGNLSRAQPIFHPGDELNGREDSLDLYSRALEDSYSETSDDFSNESGENRFPPVAINNNTPNTPQNTPIVVVNNNHNHHSPLEMNFLVQNPIGSGLGMDSASLGGVVAPVRPTLNRHNPYADAAYYNHIDAVQGPAVSLLHSQQQPSPYHPSMIVHSPSYHPPLSQNPQPLYATNNHHPYSTDASQQQQQQLLLNHGNHNHTYNTNVVPAPEYNTNGYTSLGVSNANGCDYNINTTGSSVHHQTTIQHHHHHLQQQPHHENNSLNFLSHNIGSGVVENNNNGGNTNCQSSSLSSSSLLNNNSSNGSNIVTGLRQEQLEQSSTHNNNNNHHHNSDAPAYTDLNNVTSYTKLEPFTDILHSANGNGGASKNSFQTLQQISKADEDLHNRECVVEDKTLNSDEDGLTENFGEIIKKRLSLIHI